MSLFNRKGMLKFPKPKYRSTLRNISTPYIIKECFCPNGHNLINDDVIFNNSKGILVEVSRFNERGTLSLSPFYGCKNKISNGISLKINELYDIKCPTCQVLLPTFNNCHCGGKIVSLFMNREGSFTSFVGVCNRIGCPESNIKLDDELIKEVMIAAI